MKLLYCMECTTIISPQPTANRVRFCDCGQASIRWIDPHSGTLEVKALNLSAVRVIGLNNNMLRAAAIGPEEGHSTDDWWRRVHDGLAAEADGYLFNQELRNCWAVIVAQGETSDITWVAG